MSDCILFVARIFNIHGSGVLTAFFGCCMADATWNCCRLGASSVYTIQPYTSFRPSTTTSRDVEEQGKCAHKGRRDGELMFRHRYLRQSNKMSNDWYHRSQLDKGKWRNKQNEGEVTLGGRAQELCESFTKLPLVGWLQFFGLNWSRGGHPGPPVLFSYDLSGRKASLNLNWNLLLLFIACI